MSETKLKWFDIALEEYKSLRTEVGDAIKNQQPVINYGMSAIGIMVGFGAQKWDQSLVVQSIFLVLIPVMCNLILFIWTGEVYRMSRAGLFIQELEQKINREARQRLGATQEALSWENWLRGYKKSTKNLKSNRNYLAIIAMFAALSAISTFLGAYHHYAANRPLLVWDWLFVSFLAIGLGNLAMFGYHLWYYRQIKR